MRRNLVLRTLGPWVLGVLAFLLITNKWTAPKVWANDALSYGLMERAAPGVPHGSVVGSAYAGRWIPHYLVGLLASLGIADHAAYWIVGIAMVTALVVLVALLVQALHFPPAIGIMVLLGLAAAPYATSRATLLAPGLLQDETFVLGLAITLLGLIRVRAWMVVAGVLVAIAGRQTGLPVLLAVAAWVWLDEPWRAQVADQRRRTILAVGAIVPGVVLYAVILAITRPFTYAFGPDGLHDTIVFSWPGLHGAASHVGRTLIPAVVPALVLLATWAARWRAGARPRDVSVRTWLLLAFWLLIFLQPLVISPDYPGFSSNEQRLAGLGLLPLWLAMGIELRDAVAAQVLRADRAVLAVAGVALVLTTLSHTYTSIGPSNLRQFVVLQVIAAIALALTVLAAAARAGRPAVPAA